MRTRFGLGAWTLAGLLTLATCFLFVLGWAIPTMISDDEAARSTMPWNWVVGGLFVGAGMALVLVRPILIPWTVVGLRRAWRATFRSTLLHDAPADAPDAGLGDDADRMLIDAEAAAVRAAEVQEILDAARVKELLRQRVHDTETQA